MSQPQTDLPDVDKRTDGPCVTRIDPDDPAALLYQILVRLRKTVALRDLMLSPLRYSYAGQSLPDIKNILPSWSDTFSGMVVGELRVPSAAGPIRCQTYQPCAGVAGLPVIIYCHGGGFMVGCSEDTDYMTRKISSVANAVVISVNYRLAPEWPFPTGLDDCLEVYRWARTHADAIGGDTRRVGVAGDSSGANFAAVLPLRARDHGLPAPDVTIQFAPVLDMHFEEYESYEQMASIGIVFDAPFLAFARAAYCRYAEWSHPHVSPIRGDLRGYPPALILVGTNDSLFASCRAFAAALRAAGNKRVELFVAEEMPHGFCFWPDVFPKHEADAYATVADFLGKYL